MIPKPLRDYLVEQGVSTHDLHVLARPPAKGRAVTLDTPYTVRAALASFPGRDDAAYAASLAALEATVGRTAQLARSARHHAPDAESFTGPVAGVPAAASANSPIPTKLKPARFSTTSFYQPNPKGPSSSFFGRARRKFIDHVFEEIKAGRSIKVILTATRRAGKTVMVRELANMAKLHGVPVLILDGQAFAGATGDDFYRLLNRILFDDSETQEGDPKENFFARIEQLTKKGHPLLLFDEAVGFYEGDPYFFKRLRTFNGRLSVVFTSFAEHFGVAHAENRADKSQTLISTSPSLNTYERTPLPPFDEEDLRAFLGVALFSNAKSGPAFDPGFIKAMADLTAGNVVMALVFASSIVGCIQRGEMLVSDLFSPPQKEPPFLERFPVFQRTAIHQFSELILNPMRNGKIGQFNMEAVLSRMCSFMLDRQTNTANEDVVFDRNFLDAAIQADASALDHLGQILEYFAAQGMISLTPTLTGGNTIRITNYTVFLFYGRQRRIATPLIQSIYFETEKPPEPSFDSSPLATIPEREWNEIIQKARENVTSLNQLGTFPTVLSLPDKLVDREDFFKPFALYVAGLFIQAGNRNHRTYSFCFQSDDEKIGIINLFYVLTGGQADRIESLAFDLLSQPAGDLKLEDPDIPTHFLLSPGDLLKRVQASGNTKVQEMWRRSGLEKYSTRALPLETIASVRKRAKESQVADLLQVVRALELIEASWPEDDVLWLKEGIDLMLAKWKEGEADPFLTAVEIIVSRLLPEEKVLLNAKIAAVQADHIASGNPPLSINSQTVFLAIQAVTQKNFSRPPDEERTYSSLERGRLALITQFAPGNRITRGPAPAATPATPASPPPASQAPTSAPPPKAAPVAKARRFLSSKIAQGEVLFVSPDLETGAVLLDEEVDQPRVRPGHTGWKPADRFAPHAFNVATPARAPAPQIFAW